MTLIKFEDLLDTGAHFGHVTRKWHPNYKPYVLMEKNGVHIINLDETISSFKKATDFIQGIVKKNGEILFIILVIVTLAASRPGKYIKSNISSQ